MSSATDTIWQERLIAGDADGAWDAFLAAYRRLLFASIGALVRDPESRMDAFAAVCEGLRADGLRRLRAWQPAGPARFSTWLVTVTRNLVVDWFRAREGRRRIDPALERLSAEHRALYALLTERGLSYVEAYEVLRSRDGYSGTFPGFLRMVRELYQQVQGAAGSLARELVGTDVAWELAAPAAHQAVELLDHERAMAALARQGADVRVATLLFVVDDVPADEVARIVGWPGRKAVYNRVYRALAAVRRELESGAVSNPGPAAVERSGSTRAERRREPGGPSDG